MRKWLPAVLIAAALAFSLVAWPRLPEQMVTHWNVRGEPDGYSSRFMGAFMLPVFTLGIWLLLLAVPHIDPRRANIEKFRDTYETLIIAVVGLLTLLHGAVVGAALGWPIAISRLAPFAVGAMLVILGNLLPRFRSNFFMGIRTPWTLSSETVWMKTHRVGGYLIVAAGLLLIASAFVRSTVFSYVAIGATAAAALTTLVYSYLVWRAESR
ncbi:MAG TPA: DUF1648 domain-containing protein [Gemmatimonadaceae bacterium]|nr:DUF1648 domain-containing protein [Gemmatimonadaceae bacterium]